MLPPAPRLSTQRQVLGWISRPEAVMERARRECGDVFTLQLPLGPIVAVADPALIKQVFTGDSDVLRAGEGNAPLEPVVGPDSLLLLDGARHLRRRRLVLPPLHGERLKAYTSTMAQITPRPPRGRAERTRRRAIVLAPSAGGRTIVSPRPAPRGPRPAPAAPHASAASSARP